MLLAEDFFFSFVGGITGYNKRFNILRKLPNNSPETLIIHRIRYFINYEERDLRCKCLFCDILD